MIVAVLVTSILLNVSYQYSYEKDYLSEFEEKDQALEKLQCWTDKAIRSMDDSAVTRYDQYKTGSYVDTCHVYGNQQYFLLFQCGQWKYQPFL